VRNRMLVLKRYALAREILRCAQDDGKKASGARVILSESCCSEESRRKLRCPALVVPRPDRARPTRVIERRERVQIPSSSRAPFRLTPSSRPPLGSGLPRSARFCRF
jgi:hypothetical protein